VKSSLDYQPPKFRFTTSQVSLVGRACKPFVDFYLFP
jgi:hypothetical protein